MLRILAVFAFLSLSFSAVASEQPAQHRLTKQVMQLLAVNSPPPRACFNTSDCLPQENCLNGMCVFGRCFSDLDCAIGEHCVAGTCKR